MTFGHRAFLQAAAAAGASPAWAGQARAEAPRLERKVLEGDPGLPSRRAAFQSFPRTRESMPESAQAFDSVWTPACAGVTGGW